MAKYIDADVYEQCLIENDWDKDTEEFSTSGIFELLHDMPNADVIEIPKGATNGDMIKAMFGIADNDIDEGLSTTYVYTKTRVLKGGLQDYLREQITFNRDWWNAPYKRGNENGSN